MRIAVIFDCWFPLSTGGGERQYRLFSETFVAAGHQVDYLTRRQWPAGQEVPDSGASGITVVPVMGQVELYDPAGNRRPLPALRFALAVFRHLLRARGRYDAVLVSALPVLNVFAARAALIGSRTTLCSDFLEVWRPQQWVEYSGPVLGRVASTLQRLAVRVSPLVSCHSRMNGTRLSAAGARTAPIVSPGLIHQTDPGPAAPAAGDPPTVVFAGRHIPDKRVETIPAAVAWARRQLPDLRAVIMGDGQQRGAVQAEVDRLGLGDVVTLPGFVSQQEMEAQVRNAAVLVNPSRREGYGLVVVEACGVGTPVVLVHAPDNASVELIDEGVNGYVADSTTPEVLGAAIVAAVMGGESLRASTRAWFDTAVTERTADAAARAILARLLPKR